MSKVTLILVGYLGFVGCRSSYDEARSKPEVARTTPTAVTNVDQTNKTEMPVIPAQPANPTPSSPTPSTTTGTGSGDGTQPKVDPGSIMVQHQASQDELKKYNCKGTAVISDSGMDLNQNNLLEESEIKETRIDCTEVVPGGG